MVKIFFKNFIEFLLVTKLFWLEAGVKVSFSVYSNLDMDSFQPIVFNLRNTLKHF